MNRKFLLIFALLLIVGAYIHLVKPRPILLENPLSEFPVVVGEWRMIREDTFPKEVMKILRPTDYLSREYVDSNGHRVDLYIGYHGGRKGDGGIHSPRNCLPSSGWYIDSNGLIPVPLHDGKTIDIVNAVMSKNVETISFYYWFQVQGRILTDEYALKLAQTWDSLAYRRQDAAFVRISMPIEDAKKGHSPVLDRFVADFYPEIYQFLPK